MAFYKVRLQLVISVGSGAGSLTIVRDVALPFPPFEGLILAGLGARLGFENDPSIASVSYDVEGAGGELTAHLCLDFGGYLYSDEESAFLRRAEDDGWRVVPPPGAVTGSAGS